MQPLENTANLFDAVLFPNYLGLAVTNRALDGCQERLLQKFDVETGATYWRCHLPTTVSTSHAASRLIALDNGGAMAAVEMSGTPANAALLAVDEDGSAMLYESLPLKIGFTKDVTPTMAGSRWIVNGVDPTTSRETIMAFDVPGLHAATSGWITSGGSLSRDGTPLLE
jgi:hypothetical protein